jgi:ankyrin repeat protein
MKNNTSLRLLILASIALSPAVEAMPGKGGNPAKNLVPEQNSPNPTQSVTTPLPEEAHLGMIFDPNDDIGQDPSGMNPPGDSANDDSFCFRDFELPHIAQTGSNPNPRTMVPYIESPAYLNSILLFEQYMETQEQQPLHEKLVAIIAEANGFGEKVSTDLLTDESHGNDDANPQSSDEEADSLAPSSPSGSSSAGNESECEDPIEAVAGGIDAAVEYFQNKIEQLLIDTFGADWKTNQDAQTFLNNALSFLAPHPDDNTYLEALISLGADLSALTTVKLHPHKDSPHEIGYLHGTTIHILATNFDYHYSFINGYYPMTEANFKRFFLTQNDNGDISLHIAALFVNDKHLKWISDCFSKLLLENSELLETLVNFQNNQGQTPLHLAISALSEDSAIEIVDLLINLGADVNILNQEGHTPLDLLLAYPFGNKDVKRTDDDISQCQQALIKAGAKTSAELQQPRENRTLNAASKPSTTRGNPKRKAPQDEDSNDYKGFGNTPKAYKG